MSGDSEILRSLEVISGVLLRCVVLGAVLLLWFVLFLAGGEMAHGIHGKLFDITKHGFEFLNYCEMVLLKVLVFVAFLIPQAHGTKSARHLGQSVENDSDL